MSKEKDDVAPSSRFAAEVEDIKMLGRITRIVDHRSHAEREEADHHDWWRNNEVVPPPKKDEHYIIDICDCVLGSKADRQARLPFLIGDPGKEGRRVQLPVDAYYPSLRLVIEYHEPQHTKAVAHFDKPDRLTVSGVHRGEQRKRYDELRRTILPQHGLKLVVLSFDDFVCRAAGRLERSVADFAVVRKRLRLSGVDLCY